VQRNELTGSLPSELGLLWETLGMIEKVANIALLASDPTANRVKFLQVFSKYLKRF
jgi:hypothetical protein